MYQDDVNDFVLVSLLLTFNRPCTFICVSVSDFDRVHDGSVDEL